MKIKLFFSSILILLLLHSCYLDYTKWYDIGPTEKAWFIKDAKTIAFVNDSTKQIFIFSLTKTIHDYEEFAYIDGVYRQGEYYQFYYDCEQKYSIVLSTNGKGELAYLWDKINKTEYDIELTIDNSEFSVKQMINNVVYSDVLHYTEIIPVYSFNNNDSWYKTLRGTNLSNSTGSTTAYILSNTTKTDKNILVECWYAKQQGFLKFVITD